MLKDIKTMGSLKKKKKEKHQINYLQFKLITGKRRLKAHELPQAERARKEGPRGEPGPRQRCRA